MKALVTLIATSLVLAACSSTPPKPTASSEMDSRFPASQEGTAAIIVKGDKAHYLMGLLEKLGASEQEGACAMGSCYAKGEISILCKYPNNSNRDKKMSCSVTTRANSKASLDITGGEAKRLLSLMTTANAMTPDDSPCGMGSCYEAGTIQMLCKYPNDPTGQKQAYCEVIAAKTR